MKNKIINIIFVIITFLLFILVGILQQDVDAKYENMIGQHIIINNKTRVIVDVDQHSNTVILDNGVEINIRYLNKLK